MNKSTIIVTILIVLVVLGFVLFSGSTPANNIADNELRQTELSAELDAGTYEIDTASSTVQWTASKSFVDGYTDTGEFPVTGRVVVADDGSVTATTTFDIANLEVTNVSNQDAGTDRLASHLRSEDFFAAEEYPTSTLVSTDVTAATSATTSYSVTADLTMKGATNEVNFPAEVGMHDDSLVVRADTEIDRSRWDIRYGSPSFFNDLGDSAISDTVNISVGLVGTPTTTSETNN